MFEEKPGTTNPPNTQYQDKPNKKPTSLILKPANTKTTQPSLLKKAKKVTVENQSPKNSKILNVKEFLARKKLERESKMSKLNQCSSINHVVVSATHPDTATTHNSADTFHTTEMNGATSDTRNQTK